MCKHPIKILVLELASIGVVSLHTANVWANPQDGQVVAGSATITQETPNKVGITQTTDKAIIDWNSFSINANEHTQFHQPSASSVTLNRVVGEDPSQILGRLTANGQVFLVNPNGIYFGKNAQVDVAGLVASTHNIRNEDFLAGRYNFNIPGKPGAAVINEGTINIADTGIAAFVAPSAANRGVIVAKLGKVVLAAANGFTLDFHGDDLLTFLVNDEVAKTAFDLEGKQLTSFVENAGRIEAQGGYVLLTAKAAENAIHSVINQSGSIEATTVGTHNGEIILNAGKGSLSVSGTLDASAPSGGDGGFIETSGGHVAIDPATRITTAALFGTTGRWLIDPTDYTIAASGGDIIGSALANYLSASNVEIQTLATGSSGNGDIFVNDSVTWNTLNKLTLTAHRNIYVNQAINGTGGGSVKLRADSLGTGVGTVAFSGNGHVTVNNGAAVGIYYNPVNYYDASTRSDTGGNPYSNFVTLNSSGYLNAYMLVNNVDQLQAINTNFSGTYALGKDIDASATAGWNSGAGFMPIGGYNFTGGFYNNFSGNFNGLGQTINNLFINRPLLDYVGLFTGLSGTVSHVGLVGGSITGGALGAGSLVGLNVGTIVHVFSTLNVTGIGSASNVDTGGLVGVNRGFIEKAYATGVVVGGGGAVKSNGGTTAGGLVGWNDNGSITNSFSTGSVSNGAWAGGLVGANGLFNHSGSILNSYSTGSVSGTGIYVGGLVGQSGGTITNAYWDTFTSGRTTSGGGTGLTHAQMKQQASFSGWDFANTWQITEGVSRPTLKAAVDQPVTVLTPSGTPVQQHQTNSVNSSNSGAKSEQVRRNEDYLVRIVTMKPYEMEVAGYNSRDDIYKKNHKNYPKQHSPKNNSGPAPYNDNGGVVPKKNHKNLPQDNPKSTYKTIKDLIGETNNLLTVGKAPLTGLGKVVPTISVEEIKLAQMRISDHISTITPQIEQLESKAKSLTNSYKSSLSHLTTSTNAIRPNDPVFKLLLESIHKENIEYSDKLLGQLADTHHKLVDAKQSRGNAMDTTDGLKKLGAAVKFLEGAGNVLDAAQITIGGSEIAWKWGQGEQVTRDDFNKLGSDVVGVAIPIVSLYKAYGSLSGMNNTIENSFKSMVSTSQNLQNDMQSVYAKISYSAFKGEKITASDFEGFSKFMENTTKQLESLDTKFKTIGVLSSVNVVFEGKTEEYGNMISEWHQTLAAFKKIDANSFMAKAYATGLKERYNADMAVVVSKTAALFK